MLLFTDAGILRCFPLVSFMRIFLKENNVNILISISLKFVPGCSVNNLPTLVEIMAWRRSGDKPLSKRGIPRENENWIKILAHPPPLVLHICIRESDEHCFRYWLVAYSAPSHYLNEWWIIVKQTIRNKLPWNSSQNTKFLIHVNAFEKIVCEMEAILSRVGGDELTFSLKDVTYWCSSWL